jgi:hypothetical protein
MEDKTPKNSLPPLPWWISYYESFTFGLTMVGTSMMMYGIIPRGGTSRTGSIFVIVGAFFTSFGIITRYKTVKRD